VTSIGPSFSHLGCLEEAFFFRPPPHLSFSLWGVEKINLFDFSVATLIGAIRFFSTLVPPLNFVPATPKDVSFSGFSPLQHGRRLRPIEVLFFFFSLATSFTSQILEQTLLLSSPSHCVQVAKGARPLPSQNTMRRRP